MDEAMRDLFWALYQDAHKSGDTDQAEYYWKQAMDYHNASLPAYSGIAFDQEW